MLQKVSNRCRVVMTVNIHSAVPILPNNTILPLLILLDHSVMCECVCMHQPTKNFNLLCIAILSKQSWGRSYPQTGHLDKVGRSQMKESQRKGSQRKGFQMKGSQVKGSQRKGSQRKGSQRKISSTNKPFGYDNKLVHHSIMHTKGAFSSQAPGLNLEYTAGIYWLLVHKTVDNIAEAKILIFNREGGVSLKNKYIYLSVTSITVCIFNTGFFLLAIAKHLVWYDHTKPLSSKGSA